MEKWERSGTISTYQPIIKSRVILETHSGTTPLTAERRLPPQREYLMTLEVLYEAAIVNLGPMDTKSYEEIKEEMQRVARERGGL